MIKKKTMVQLFTVLMILFLSLNLIRCGESYTIDDGDKLEPSEGILLINMKYLEGVKTYESITFIVERLDKSFFFRITMERNTRKWILVRLKAGKYFFSNIKAKADAEYKGGGETGNLPHFEGQFSENVFDVRPGVINYLGDMIIQTKREHLGKSFSLVPPNVPLREYTYFLNSYIPKTVMRLKKEYPRLVKNYPVQKRAIFFGSDSQRIKEQIQLEGGQGEYTEGVTAGDERGYRDYRWGTSLEKVMENMKDKKLKFKWIKEKNRLVAIENNIKTYYFFSKSREILWKDKLYRVVLLYRQKAKPLVKKIIDNYGTPEKYYYPGLLKNKNFIHRVYGKKKGKINKWIWGVPSTLLVMEAKKKITLLSYISKEYILYLKSKEK